MEIRKVPISLLNAAPYNPRKDLQPGDPEYQKIARSIEKYGCVEPIIWNEKTGNVMHRCEDDRAEQLLHLSR